MFKIENMQYSINIINQANIEKYNFIINKWKLKNKKDTPFSLIIKPNRIELKNNLYPTFKNLWVNFDYINFKKYIQKQNMYLLKAIGKKKDLHILDVTGGLGRDAFIFFVFGYTVTIIENHPILSILLYDGLCRGIQDPIIGKLLKKKMKIIYNNSLNLPYLNIPTPDIIYMDPMFPYKKKNSLSKKNIRTIRQLVGHDTNSNDLFQICKKITKNKIVVKRPKYANYISNIIPNFNIKTKKYRFDIYILNKNLI